MRKIKAKTKISIVVGIALLISFTIFLSPKFVKSQTTLSITCDKNIYYGLTRIEAYCNVTDSGIASINFTSSFPGVVYGLEGIYDLRNVTYEETVIDHYEYYEGTNHTGEVWLVNFNDTLYLNYTANATENYTLIPLTYVWNYSNSSSEGAFDGWWTSNASRPVYVNVTKWKYDWVPLSYITYESNGIKKYGIEGYDLSENSGIFKIVFNVPPNTQGKFNLTVTADSQSFILDPWWNSTWLYRRPITIDNTANPNTLTDYQVLVTLDTQALISQGKMNSDCSDIRFSYSNPDGTEIEIPYWVESDCNTPNTKIWVKVPNIPASSTTTIYVYYGNPSATSLSDLNSVSFIYYNSSLSFSTTSTTDTLVASYNFSSTSPFYLRVLPGFLKVITYTSSTTYSCYQHIYIDSVTTVFHNWIGNINTACGTVPTDYPSLPNILPSNSSEYGLNCLRVATTSSTTISNSKNYTSYNYNTLFSGLSGVTVQTSPFSSGTHTVYLYARQDNSAQTCYITYWEIRFFKAFNPEPTTNIGAEEVFSPFDNVVLVSPSEGQLVNSLTVNFTFIPTFYEDIYACYLYTNETGIWSQVEVNSTPIVNGTSNVITHTFSSSGVYTYNIGCANSTTIVFAPTNRTFKIDLPPTWSNQGQNVSSVPPGGAISLFVYGKDDFGLVKAIFSTNETGIWQNVSGSPISPFTKITVNSPLITNVSGTWEASIWIASVTRMPNGTWVMAYEGYNSTYNTRKIGLAFADKPEGPWVKYSNNPVFWDSSCWNNITGTPFIYYNNTEKMFYLYYGCYNGAQGDFKVAKCSLSDFPCDKNWTIVGEVWHYSPSGFDSYEDYFYTGYYMHNGTVIHTYWGWSGGISPGCAGISYSSTWTENIGTGGRHPANPIGGCTVERNPAGIIKFWNSSRNAYDYIMYFVEYPEISPGNRDWVSGRLTLAISYDNTNTWIIMNDTTLFTSGDSSAWDDFIGSGGLYYDEESNIVYFFYSGRNDNTGADGIGLAVLNLGKYGSPMQLNNSKEAWINFTWQNPSIPAGTIVGWRVYLEDSSGQSAVTDPMTFVVGAPALSVVFNYNSVDFGTVTPNTIAEAKSINYNVSVTSSSDYKVSVSATDWSGPTTIPANTLYFALNDTLDKITFSAAKQLSNAVQLIATFPSSVTTNYHAFYFNVPLAPPDTYTATITITYEVV